MDDLEAMEGLMTGEEELDDATLSILFEQAKQAKAMVSPWARVGLDRCASLFGRLQVNGLEVTCSASERPRKLPRRGHGRWAQGATVGIGLYPSAALLNHSCQPNCRVDYGDDGFLSVRWQLFVCSPSSPLSSEREREREREGLK